MWIDLSHPISPETPPFPGDPAVEIDVLDKTEATDRSLRDHLNCSRISLCIHCGTHLDAPYHFYANGRTVDSLALDACCGDALLLHLEGSLSPQSSAAGGVIDAALLQAVMPVGELPPRIILRTDWFRCWGSEKYFRDHPVISEDGARWMVENGIRLVGVDFPSVDQPPFPAHLELLGNDVIIVENLTRLDQLPEDEFEFFATPLAIVGRDGSPVRAAARIRRQ